MRAEGREACNPPERKEAHLHAIRRTAKFHELKRVKNTDEWEEAFSGHREVLQARVTEENIQACRDVATCTVSTEVPRQTIPAMDCGVLWQIRFEFEFSVSGI